MQRSGIENQPNFTRVGKNVQEKRKQQPRCKRQVEDEGD